MADYKEWYEEVSSPFRDKPERVKLLNLLNHGLVVLMYLAYPFLLLYGYRETGDIFNPAFLKLILVPGISFILVSLVRKGINRKRPYETWDIHPLVAKDKKGESMPSRHVFSEAVISMAWLYVFPPLGMVLLAVSLLGAAIRVIGGVHYPTDVAAGYAVGVLAGLFLWLV
ncbi:phosphatase PAP2 family protein [uncultured Dialister sp.]|jgi:membrane-associated phospholipid phosphatase|uniref:phosphatase PAP2 family protein n=1 Tax=uncultured Dialister sp. TaxID=278064 RepID=UPI0025DB7DC4|nr:phosphatase PAP2 family protein [uncultured Dialister sp.]